MKERRRKLKRYFSDFDYNQKYKTISLLLDFENYEFIDNFQNIYPIMLVRNVKDDTIYEFNDFIQNHYKC